MKGAVIVLCALMAVLCTAKTFWREDFDDSWRDRWVTSKTKEEDGTGGIFKYECGRYCASEEEKGMRTGEDARFYQISSKFETPFSNRDTDLVVTYTVKNEQSIDCGGWYLKLGPPGLDLKSFNDKSEYNIMIGPDVCGAVKRIHYILNYKGENFLVDDARANLGEPEREAEKVHAYTFVLKADKTYAVYVDGMKRGEGGRIDEHWDVLGPKEIPDPDAKKPDDWVDEEKIADPTAVKPKVYDEPAEIVDTSAKKPADWDDDVDGEWIPPMRKNPKYKGDWKPPMIDNPAYKGAWVHPKVPNPAYKYDAEVGVYEFGWIGLDVWQLKAGSIFTHIWIGDDVKEQLDWVRSYVKDVRDKESAKQAEQQAKDAEEARRRMEADEFGFEEDEDDHDEL